MASEPLHHWILALDMEGFSTRTDPVQRSLRAEMYDIVDHAFEQAGLAGFGVTTEDRGDGALMVVPATVPPVRLAGTFVRALDDGLQEKAALFGSNRTLRLRLAMHQGLAAEDDHGWSGDAVNTACRLVDAEPLRETLRAAERGRLAFAVSAAVYESVVRPGHRGIDPAAYAPLSFRTKHGETIRGWVTVPGYSAPPELPRPAPDATRGPAAPDAAQPPAAPPAAHGSGPVFSIGKVRGDVVGGDKHVHAPGRDHR
ncbi:hypothetical protein [Actinacidiphila acididurans]|uniref:Guanylate cyclase domain-containing protein n=1 Tax=Actinacidiphila acididurans TaxID=2784346 RepID=A0ABS2U219_9ACTN|nr:hypothetical protein [Actinacidiphila acididurans]MBM9509638.1 hypothetical protein [Actinacidiphila acididurans]